MIAFELAQKVLEIVRSASDDPSEQLIKEGQALVSIGKALAGQSRQDCIKIMQSVEALTR